MYKRDCENENRSPNDIFNRVTVASMRMKGEESWDGVLFCNTETQVGAL